MGSLSKLLVASAILCAAFTSHSALSKAVKVTEVEGISEYKLDNGLRILLFPDQSKETVTVNVTYEVGSKHENYGETGMAHLLEHLVFKGSPRHKDIPKELSAHGASPNGTTWTDRTNYFETFAATEENIDWALDLESDRMVNSFIAQKDLDSEMTVVRNEFERGENSPFRVLLQRVMAASFSWHNYGKSTIGARSDIENVSIDRLKAFYKKYYQPDNATLIVAGKFKKASMLKKIEQYFEPIPKPDRQLQALYTREPAQDGEKSVTVRRVGDVQLYVSAYHVPAGSHPDFAALEVLSGILGDTPRGRLHQNIVLKKLASRAYGFNFQWAEPGLMLFGLEVDKAADINKTEEAVNTLIEGLSDRPINKDEVERSKRKLIKNFDLSFDSSQAVALELSEWIGMGDWRLMFLNRDRIEKVSLADVQRVAETYLTRNNRTSGTFVPSQSPERVDIPAVASVADMLKDYKGREALSEGEDFNPSFDNIDKRSTVHALSENLKLTLLPKKTRGETVSVNMSFSFGDLESLKGQRDIADAVGAMLMRGTTKYSREQIQDELDTLKAQVSIGGSATGAFVSINTKKEQLPKVIDLIAHILKEPSFNEKEFKQYLDTAKVDLEQNLQNPQALAFREFSRRHRNYDTEHPYYVPSYQEAIANLETIKLDRLADFHQRFYGSSHGQIAVVGDFDESKMLPLLKQHFANWASKKPFVRIDRPYQDINTQKHNFDTPDKENAVFVATAAMALSDEDKQSPALVLGNYMLGGGFLNSRLANKLRQEDGLSYSAGSFLNQSSLDERSSIGIYAICAPQNLSKVEMGVKEVLASIIKDGFTEQEIADAKSGYLQSTKVGRTKDGRLASTLNNNAYLGRNMQWSESFENQIQALTPQDIHKVMQQYLNIEDFAIITGGDAKKIK